MPQGPDVLTEEELHAIEEDPDEVDSKRITSLVQEVRSLRSIVAKVHRLVPGHTKGCNHLMVKDQEPCTCFRDELDDAIYGKDAD